MIAMRKKSDSRTRRSVLKVLGAASACLSVPASTVAGVSSNQSSEAAFSLDTSGYTALDTANVEIYDGGVVRVGMGGTASPDVSTRGYRVDVADLRSNGQFTPSNANASLSRIPDVAVRRQPKKGTKKTISGGNSSSTTHDGGLNTMGESNGSDDESDYEGGCWVRSEDAVDLPLCKSNHWVSWSTSNGETDHVDRKYDAEAWQYSVPDSDWKVDSASFKPIDWSGNDATSDFNADYINWTWRKNDKSTSAYHRTHINCNPDGSLTWWADHWHEGEDSGTLRTDSGIYSSGQV